mgnify:CR=1 FL=1
MTVTNVSKDLEALTMTLLKTRMKSRPPPEQMQTRQPWTRR